MKTVDRGFAGWAASVRAGMGAATQAWGIGMHPGQALVAAEQLPHQLVGK